MSENLGSISDSKARSLKHLGQGSESTAAFTREIELVEDLLSISFCPIVLLASNGTLKLALTLP